MRSSGRCRGRGGRGVREAGRRLRSVFFLFPIRSRRASHRRPEPSRRSQIGPRRKWRVIPGADFSLFPTLTPHCLLALASLEDAATVSRVGSCRTQAPFLRAARPGRWPAGRCGDGGSRSRSAQSIRSSPNRCAPRAGICPSGTCPSLHGRPIQGRLFRARRRPSASSDISGERGASTSSPPWSGEHPASGYRVVLHDTAGHFGAGDVRPAPAVQDLRRGPRRRDDVVRYVVCPMDARRYGIDTRASCGVPWPADCRWWCRRGRSPP